MKLEIQDAIRDLVPPEQLLVILDVVDTLSEKDYVLALDELNTVLMLADDMADSSMLVARINDVLHYAMTYCLNEHDIVMTDDAPLNVRHAVYKTIIYLPQYIIPSDIANLFQAGYDNIETIAQLVPYFTYLETHDVIEHIESVEDQCIAELRSQIQLKLSTQGEYSGERIPVERIRAINKLIATNGREKFTMLLELSDAGVRVGRPYDELLNISFEQLESRNPLEAASELVGLAFFSDLPLDGIWRKIDVGLDEYTDNPMERRIMLDEIANIKRNVGNLDETT